METGYIAVADESAVSAGTCKSFDAGGKRIIIAHLADGFHAIEDRCSHAGAALDCRRVYSGGQIACPRHGARFDLRTGVAKSAPAFQRLAVFPVRVAGGMIEVARTAV